MSLLLQTTYARESHDDHTRPSQVATIEDQLHPIDVEHAQMTASHASPIAHPGRLDGQHIPMVPRVARVSVVDDSSDFLDLMRELIEDLGYQMTGFTAVKVSIEEIVDSQPDLLIVDLRLQDTPQMISGWEAVVLARSHRHLISVPVILCTGDLREIEKRSADLEQITGVHVLTKPFSVDEMSELITELLEDAPERLEVGAS
jgi:CheY-like chemotaxis protein